jgi:hypothetical protein
MNGPSLDRSWALLIEAGAVLTAARLTLLTRRFDRAIRFGSVPLGEASSSHSVGAIIRSIEAMARRAPFRALCIEQGLAAQRMLRRAGADAVLHYGARHDDGALKAHVWVTIDGEVVIGGAQAPRFREVAAYS